MRRRRKNKYVNWTEYNRIKRFNISNTYGHIDNDVEMAFYQLPSDKMEALLNEYGRKYGKSPKSYVKKTFKSWKYGDVKLSGQIAERLIELLPPFLTVEQRYILIRKLRLYYLELSKKTVYLSTTPDTWHEKVLSEVDKMISSSKLFMLPEHISKKIEWLSNGDAEVVHKILCSIEEEISIIKTDYLETEMKRINELVLLLNNNNTTVIHDITLPQGTINLTIEKNTHLKAIESHNRSNKMKENENSENNNELLKPIKQNEVKGQLLNLAFDELAENHKIELKKKIIEEKINLEISQARAAQRFVNSTEDMANIVRVVNHLEKTSNSDFEIESSMHTASGKTKITVKKDDLSMNKSDNTVIIIVFVVIGVIILVILGSL